MIEEMQVRLKILEILTPTASKLDITKDQLVGEDGIAEKFVQFVMKQPGKAKAKTA